MALQVIETNRLILRPPSMDDAPAIFQSYAQDDEVTRYLMWSAHRSLSETHAFLRSCLAADQSGASRHWVITRKADHTVLGMIVLRMEDFKADTGYVLAREEWGKGYMTEALRAVIDFAFTMKSIYRVWAVCDVDNVASARVMEKSGMVREGVLRRFMLHPNAGAEPRDVLCYAKTR
jgi:ribosomal-protein-alanine N-acetyltransferase